MNRDISRTKRNEVNFKREKFELFKRPEMHGTEVFLFGRSILKPSTGFIVVQFLVI